MALTDTSNRVQYEGDGSTVSFPITFVFWDADDPQAILTDSNGVETTWVRGTQYTISGGGSPGATGTLTVITSPTDYTPQGGGTPELLTIKSNLANTQPTSIPAGGSFSTIQLEQQLDQMVRQLQQESEETDRSIKLKVSSAESGVTIEDLDGNTAKFLQVNTAEDGFTYAVVTSSGTITDPVPVANGGTGSASAATALTALAAAGTGISNTFSKTQIWTKGGDLTSASPLVLGTDGNYFDVAGTTGFSQITVTAGTLFMLQFNGALTLTDGASLILPGNANITTAAGDVLIGFATAANTVQVMFFPADGHPIAGDIVVQRVLVTDAAVATGTTVMVEDDSIPVKTEGDQYIAVTITPTDTANKLRITANLLFSSSANGSMIAGLFQDTTTNALAAVQQNAATAANLVIITFIHEMTAGTTSATTFKIRAGNDQAATTTFNGTAGGRLFGGVAASFIEVEEIRA